jgi:hypothetical protein
MRDPAALRDGQLGGPDVHAAIQLHRVGIHDLRGDLAAQPLDDVERQLRFASTRGADYRQGSHGCQAPAK